MNAAAIIPAARVSAPSYDVVAPDTPVDVFYADRAIRLQPWRSDESASRIEQILSFFRLSPHCELALYNRATGVILALTPTASVAPSTYDLLLTTYALHLPPQQSNSSQLAVSVDTLVRLRNSSRGVVMETKVEVSWSVVELSAGLVECGVELRSVPGYPVNSISPQEESQTRVVTSSVAQGVNTAASVTSPFGAGVSQSVSEQSTVAEWETSVLSPDGQSAVWRLHKDTRRFKNRTHRLHRTFHLSFHLPAQPDSRPLRLEVVCGARVNSGKWSASMSFEQGLFAASTTITSPHFSLVLQPPWAKRAAEAKGGREAAQNWPWEEARFEQPLRLMSTEGEHAWAYRIEQVLPAQIAAAEQLALPASTSGQVTLLSAADETSAG